MGSHPPPQQAGAAAALYDFVTALSNLQETIAALRDAAARQQPAPASRLGATWAFLRANRGNGLLLVTFYSMATASVVGSIMAEHRLQSDRLLECKEQEQLQGHINRLQQQMQRQQLVLDGLSADLQQQQQHAQHTRGWWWSRSGGGGGALSAGGGGVRQQMLQRLQRWKDEQQQEGPVSTTGGGASSGGSISDSGSDGRRTPPPQQQQQQQPNEQEEFGVRVGPLGRGFLI